MFSDETRDLIDKIRETDTYGGTAPFQKHSETSQAAADAILGEAGTIRAMVFGYLVSCKFSGATQDQVSEALDMGPQTACPRLRELEMKGAIVKTKAKRKTRSGRQAFVYVAARYL